MKRGVQIALATTVWLALGVPLWIWTLVVPRADIGAAQLERTEALASAPLPAAARIAVYGDRLPDLAPATELRVNAWLAEHGFELRFVVLPQCTPDCELCVSVVAGDEDVIGLDSGSTHLTVQYSEATLTSGLVPDIVELLLVEHVYHEELETAASRSELTVAYSPQYHITFSLLGEGGAPLSWDIGAAVATWLDALLADLRHSVANITLDTQLGFYAEPGCPRREQLTHADLATFVNFAEWSLASSMPYPTLNFVLYVPTEPLRIAGSDSNAFVVPQWGGVIIAEPESQSRRYAAADLEKPLQVFAKQLLALLGMREAPDLPPASRAPLEVRIAALSRVVARRGIRGAAASLGSLRRLAANMPHIAIPQKVADRANTAVREIDAARAALARGDLAAAAHHSASAYVNADRAFFDKHMVAQSFVPDEHKLAVYMPLLGPLFVVVIGGWLRFYREHKARRAVPDSAAAVKPAGEPEKLKAE